MHISVEPGEWKVVIASPFEYEECVAFVETQEHLLFTLLDERRTADCVVELPERDVALRISLRDLRRLLDAAERKLVGPNPSTQ